MINGENLRRDFLASLVVFLVALPLCIGIAGASGVPLERAATVGLVTGIVGGILVGLTGGAPLLVSGPAAGLAVILAGLIEKFGLPTVGVIIILAGLVQLVAGLLKLGQWFRAVSPAVIYAMLAGIGVVIFASQFHVMIDTPKADLEGLSNVEKIAMIPKTLIRPFQDIETFGPPAALAVTVLAILILWKPLTPKSWHLVPAALIAVLTASLAAYFANMPVDRVKLEGGFFASIEVVTFDTARAVADWAAVLIAVGSVAFIASAETLLSVAAVDKMHLGRRANYDRELAAQGVGNAVSGFLGGLPMTGVIVRSATNVEAGARTQASAVMHGVWLLLTVSLLPFVLEQIPLSALGALLVYTGYKLVNRDAMKKLYRTGTGEIVIYGTTLALIVGVDLLVGVVTGIALSALRLMITLSRLRAVVEDQPERGEATLHLSGAATFVGLPKLAEALEKVPAGRAVTVEAGELAYIDHACLDLLGQWESQRKAAGGTLRIDWDGLHGRYREPQIVPEGNR